MAQNASVEQLNSELTNVLSRLDVAEKTLAADAKKIDGPVGVVELREYQLQMLTRLRSVRDAMNKEGLSVEQLVKERDEARAERDTLQKQVSKLNYRVEHLKSHIAVNTTH